MLLVAVWELLLLIFFASRRTSESMGFGASSQGAAIPFRSGYRIALFHPTGHRGFLSVGNQKTTVLSNVWRRVENTACNLLPSPEVTHE
jgi:hypothetical protein